MLDSSTTRIGRTGLTGTVLLAASLAWAGVPSAHAAPVLTTLASFNLTNGSLPGGGVVADRQGNLYGTTYYGGGSANGGVLYKIDASTHALSTLVTFTGANGACALDDLVIDASGNLYGATWGGGANSKGTIFQYSTASRTFTTLLSFNGTNGANLNAGLTGDGRGNLYGTTTLGGANNLGTVFQFAISSQTLTTLASFSATSGARPTCRPVMDAAGNLYGTTYGGGANGLGTVFEVAAGTNALTTLASFNDANGNSPWGPVTLDAAGNLYGDTQAGGTYGDGVVYEIAAGSHTLTTLVNFDGANGRSPASNLLLDAAGNIYGTTEAGGASQDGTVFMIDGKTHALTTLVTFNGPNGNVPVMLSADAAGNLYGVTENGGTSNYGTVYELSGTGFVTVPEPASLSLLVLGGWTLLARRSRRA